MSPFSTLLHETRVRKNLRQAELARLTERDQTYISALELDAKGPPPREFVERVVTVLQISDTDAANLLAAAEAVTELLSRSPVSQASEQERTLT